MALKGGVWRLAGSEWGKCKKKRVKGGWGEANRIVVRAGKLTMGSALLDSPLGRVGMDWGWKERAGGLGIVRRGLGGKARVC
jgi:hypothetical protein